MARDPRYVPGGPPLKIGERHRLLITLAAMGHSNEEIAQQLNLHPVRVSMLRNSPEIKMAIERLQQQMSQETLGTFMDKIVAEAEPTLERLKELRDQDDELSVALGASFNSSHRVGSNSIKSPAAWSFTTCGSSGTGLSSAEAGREYLLCSAVLGT